MKRIFSLLAISAVLTLSAVSPAGVLGQPLVVTGQGTLDPFDRKIVKKIDAEQIYNHIGHLSEEPRVAGTEQEYRAVEYIQEEFDSYGYETEIQPFTYIGYTAPDLVELSSVDYAGELNPSYFTYSVSGDVSGEIIKAGLGTEEDVSELELTGKIALIQRGEISFAEKVLNAAGKGAAGVIIYNSSEGTLNGTLGGASDDYVPAVSLSQAEGEELSAFVESNPSAVFNLDRKSVV